MECSRGVSSADRVESLNMGTVHAIGLDVSTPADEDGQRRLVFHGTQIEIDISSTSTAVFVVGSSNVGFVVLVRILPGGLC